MLPTYLLYLTIAFLYPAYASYKALQTRPRRTQATTGAAAAAAGAISGLSGSDAEVERWLMYWAVVGVWAGVEGCVGWVLTWLPFYTLCKTAVFAYFASGRGIDYVYHNMLEPLFREHEPQIDAFISNLKARTGEGARGSIGWAWNAGRRAMGLSEAQAQNLAAAAGAAGAQPPTLADPASGAAQQAYGFLTGLASRYMPAALATVSAAAAQAQGAVNRAPGPAPTSAAAGFASGFAQATGARGFDVPSPSNSTREAGSRSRPTSLHLAQGHGHGQGHGGHGQGLGKSDSDDALSAGSGSGGSTVNLSGFAEIRREEAEGAIPAAPQGHARRTSGGWFWGKEKDKRE